jgi:CheY-like chemotaxis protein
MSSVLVVDDEPIILKMVTAVLSDLGYENTEVAPDAETALKLACEHKHDIVLTDVKLPGMDGAELARQIKANLGVASPPVVLMSAYGEPRPNPGDGFIQKPFDVDQFASVMKRHLNGRRAKRSRR